MRPVDVDAADRGERGRRQHDLVRVHAGRASRCRTKCGLIADALSVFRPTRLRVVEPNPYFFEHQGLYRYLPRPS